MIEWREAFLFRDGNGTADDLLILDKSCSEDRVCVTLHHDFHAHLAEASHGRPSVILLRVQGLDAKGQADLIRSVCVRCADALSEGAAVSADRSSIRVRRLPPKSGPAAQLQICPLPFTAQADRSVRVGLAFDQPKIALRELAREAGLENGESSRAFR